MKNFFIFRDIFSKFSIAYFPRQQHNLRTHFLDRAAIAYSCHTNASIQSSAVDFFIYVGHFSFAATVVNVFACFHSTHLKFKFLNFNIYNKSY